MISPLRMLALDSDVCPTPVTRTVAPLNTYTFLKHTQSVTSVSLSSLQSARRARIPVAGWPGWRLARSFARRPGGWNEKPRADRSLMGKKKTSPAKQAQAEAEAAAVAATTAAATATATAAKIAQLEKTLEAELASKAEAAARAHASVTAKAAAEAEIGQLELELQRVRRESEASLAAIEVQIAERHAETLRLRAESEGLLEQVEQRQRLAFVYDALNCCLVDAGQRQSQQQQQEQEEAPGATGGYNSPRTPEAEASPDALIQAAMEQVLSEPGAESLEEEEIIRRVHARAEAMLGSSSPSGAVDHAAGTGTGSMPPTPGALVTPASAAHSPAVRKGFADKSRAWKPPAAATPAPAAREVPATSGTSGAGPAPPEAETLSAALEQIVAEGHGGLPEAELIAKVSERASELLVAQGSPNRPR